MGRTDRDGRVAVCAILIARFVPRFPYLSSVLIAPSSPSSLCSLLLLCHASRKAQQRLLPRPPRPAQPRALPPRALRCPRRRAIRHRASSGCSTTAAICRLCSHRYCRRRCFLKQMIHKSDDIFFFSSLLFRRMQRATRSTGRSTLRSSTFITTCRSSLTASARRSIRGE